MSEIEFDEILTAALYRASELDIENTPSNSELDELVQPSKRFQRKMKALLHNPKAYTRNIRRPLYIKMMRVAAAIFIALAVLFSATMAVSPTVRATVANFVRTWLEDRTEYSVPPQDLHRAWTFGYIPEGFELVEEINLGLILLYTYENSNSEEILISISTGSQIVDNEHSDFYSTRINGNDADVYVSNDIEYPSIVIMIHEQTGMKIMLQSEINIEEIIKIAENISG